MATNTKSGWTIECQKEGTERFYAIQANDLVSEHDWIEHLSEKMWFSMGDFVNALRRIGLEIILTTSPGASSLS